MAIKNNNKLLAGVITAGIFFTSNIYAEQSSGEIAKKLSNPITTPKILKSTTQRAQALVPGSYVGPNGQRIQVKQTMTNGGSASDLAAKGIIVVDCKPADGRYKGPGGVSLLVKRGIIIENKPADGRYKGPGGASFLVKRGIIIENKPADGRYKGPGGASFLVKRGIIIVNTKPSPTSGLRR